MEKKDDFWDLSMLVPKKKNEKTVPHRSTDTTATEITVTPRFLSAGNADVPLPERPVHPVTKEEPRQPLFIYRPENALVREVRIYPWKSEYTYYEQFRRHAEQLNAREGKPSPEVDFFSYMPQYSQMNKEQGNYYLWWRTNFRNGVALPAAFSYLLLYLYELINLDENQISPQTGQENMLRLWLSYREKHPRLDALVREWLCDYSLLHALPPPKLDPDQYRTLLTGCRLKEYYVPADGEGDALKNAMLLFCNNYDYTKSKFYRPDTKEDYDRVLGGAVGEALRFLREESGAVLTNEGGISTVSRDIFGGAICSCRQKRHIEVDFTSFSHTHELRYVITDVLKYAENALRARKGIKSRLSVYAISVPLRTRLDAYLETVLPARRHSVKKEEVPEYERRYDLPKVEISAERANAIEQSSWQTTKRLVEAFDGEEMEITPETGAENASFCEKEAEPEQREEDAPASLSLALGELASFFGLAKAANRAAQRAFADKQGLMLDALVDKINTVAGDIVGDVLLEEENGAYVIIEDYLELLEEEGLL